MVQFLHTADWHVGMAFTGFEASAPRMQQKRFTAASNVVKIAKNEKVDFVLIAGDIFDSDYVDARTRRQVVEILNSFAPIPVYLISGNHDPFMPGGVWERKELLDIKEHVRVIKQDCRIEVGEEVVLYASPIRQKTSDLDPTEWIPAEADAGKIRIGLAHGSLPFNPQDAVFPIAVDRCQKSGLDYLALGDWHSALQSGNIVYSGCMEPTKFGLTDPGKVALVKIDCRGAKPIVRFENSGVLAWKLIEMSIEDESDVDELVSQLQDIKDISNTVLKIDTKLSPLDKKNVDRLEDLRSNYVGDAFHLFWDLEVEAKELDDSPLPAGLLLEADAELERIIKGEPDQGTPCEAEPSTARMARKLLRRMARGDDI